MDILSEILSGVRAERAMSAHFKLSAPWGLSSAGVRSLLIRMSKGSHYWMKVRDLPPTRVDPGEVVLIQPNVAHTISSDPDGGKRPFSDLFADLHIERVGRPLVIEYGGGGQEIELYSLLLWLPSYCHRIIFEALPPFVHVNAQRSRSVEVLAMAMQSLIEESFARQPGSELSMVRLGELLLVNILSEQLLKKNFEGDGWLRGLVDPHIIRALNCIHAEPEVRWTMDLLASRAAMSRSNFSSRFKAVMGVTPFAYLTNQRMLRAAFLIETGVRNVKQLADATGYESEKSFIRVFANWSGMTPSQYVKNKHPEGAGKSTL